MPPPEPAPLCEMVSRRCSRRMHGKPARVFDRHVVVDRAARDVRLRADVRAGGSGNQGDVSADVLSVIQIACGDAGAEHESGIHVLLVQRVVADIRAILKCDLVRRDPRTCENRFVFSGRSIRIERAFGHHGTVEHHRTQMIDAAAAFARIVPSVTVMSRSVAFRRCRCC